MNKSSTATPTRTPSINAGSAWARGPPASSTPSGPTSQPPSASTSTPYPTNQPIPRQSNGTTPHSRRSSAVFPNSTQPPSASALKDSLAVSKSAAAPISGMAGNLQFGTIDDSNAILSTSPAAPSAMADVKQVKSFGSISAAATESTVASPTVAKVNPPARTDSPAPASGKPKKKIDVASLFQKSQASSAPPQAAAPVPAPVPQSNQSQPVPVPIPTPQDAHAARPPPKHQGSYDSPSMRNSPLPIMSHPNQAPSPLQPGPPGAPYHFSPHSHLRQGGNGAPPFNPPRSPNLSRAVTNGSMRGPPGTPGAGALGSPRMGPPPSTSNAPTPAPSQTPMSAVPPGMMNVPQGPGGHPSHLPTPVTPMPQGQVPPHQMGMPPPPMWGYYYPPPYHDPNVPSPYYWPGVPHPMTGQHHPPPPQQQPPMPMPPSNLSTPSQAPVAMPMSPRVPPPGMPAPQTPSTPLPQGPGNRSSFISKARITIKTATGEEVDLHKLGGHKHDENAASHATPKEETTTTTAAPRRPMSVRMETEEEHKKRVEEEDKVKKEKARKDEEMAKLKAKREAEAKERAKRDQEEKERRKKEAEEADKKKLDDDERVKREAEEAEQRERDKVKREEEERLRKIQEEEDRKVKEAEQKEKARLAEIEAKRLADEEAKLKAEEDKRKADEEAKRLAEEAKKKEEEERLRLEVEEAKRLAEEAKKKEDEARLQAEAEKVKQEEEERLKQGQEAAISTPPVQPLDATSQASTPLGSTPAFASPAHSNRDLPKVASALPPALDPKNKRPIPGRLDLSSTTAANLPQPLPSALASARIIEDIGKVSYPEGIKAPNSELNVNSASGRFRYDRDFLMQFMKVCKEKPDDMPPLDAIGLEPSDQQAQFGNRRSRPPMSSTPSSARNSMAGLGLTGPGGAPFGGSKSFGGGGMGQFQAPAGRSSEERFAASIPRAVSGAVPFPRQTLGRTNSTSGPPLPGGGRRGETPQRTQSTRGNKRLDSKATLPSTMSSFVAPSAELHHTENAWSGNQRKTTQDENSPEFIERKVKGLLNKLTMEKFEPISLQILEWANRSINESDGRTLIQVIKLVFEKATDEATWSEMYARLCRFLMERISHDVRDEGIKNQDGKPIAGGNLFRKYLLNRCQEDFERGWSARESAMQAAAGKAADDKAAAVAAEKGEEALYSDEYYAAQKAKRRGLGLVKFIGELFKLQMLTERIMHECIKKLLSNVENPEEEEIESLCKLLATVGQALDTPKARNHMDIYFSRMKELANSGQISSRIQFMLLDIIELRGRQWVSRTQVAAPTTIAEIHQKAERDRQVAEREALLRQAGGRDRAHSSRRDPRDAAQPGADGWTTPTRQPAKAGDLSRFGKISKPTTMQFGPSSVFSKGEKRESPSPATRASSSSNMFAALNSSEATPDAVSLGSRTANSTRPPSRKGSVDFSVSSLADGRRKLFLQPRTQGLPSDAGSFRDDAGSAIGQSEQGDDDAASIATSAAATKPMTAEEAKRKIKEDLKELFTLTDLGETEQYFTSLPPEYHWQLIETLVTKAMDAKASDLQRIAEVFRLAASKSLVDEATFSKGFEKDMEYLEDTSTDSPNAYGNMAALLKASQLSQAAIESLGDKIIAEEDMAVMPKEKLLKKYAALTT